MERKEIRYVVVDDQKVGFFRLRRADCEDAAGSQALWSGTSLREGYDAMIRLNRERNHVSWVVVYQKGRFRAFKGGPPCEGWKLVRVYNDRESAFLGLKKWRQLWRAKAEQTLQRMGRQPSKRISLTRADRGYLSWRMEEEFGWDGRSIGESPQEKAFELIG